MPELNAAQRRALSDIENAAPDTKIDEIRWDKDFRSPKFISGTLSEPSQDDAEGIARRFLERTANLVALPPGVEEELELADITTDAQDYKHVLFQQVVNGIPVFEGSLQVHINPEGQVVGYKANRATDVDVSLTPDVTAERAIEIAGEALGEPESQKVPPKAELMLFMDDAGRTHLTWHVQLFSDEDFAPYHYFVDAHTGLILFQYGEFRHIMSRETYTANNQEVLPGDLLIKEGDPQHPDDVAWAAHQNAGIVYDYYRTRFGRDSYDNRGSVIRSTVHFSRRYNNAFWTPDFRQMVYGDGDGVTFSPLSAALDVVAHELTHAVTSSTARFVYASEAGALDESFADFFGVMISNGDPVTNWQLGEEVFTPGRVGDALRDISNPPAGGQPDHTDDQRRLAPGQLPVCNSRLPTYNDNEFVHTNSGIPNKAGFLMVAGGTHRGITVQPLGKSVAEQIMYLALTVYLQSATPSRWTFRQARLATMDACRQLFPNDEARLASVMNAWAAVGVGDPAAPPSGEAVVRAEAAPALDIPDATPAGVSSVLTIARDGNVSSLKVAVDILHTYIGDLRVVLTAPNGVSAVLHNRSGARADNIIRTYDPSNTPGLAVLVGSPVRGDWRLTVSDNARFDVGRLRRWSLEISLGAASTIRQEAVPALAIPDNDPQGIKSPLDINQAGALRDVKVWVDITHTWIGDLKVDLIAPSGKTVTLHNRTGGNQDNLISEYTQSQVATLRDLIGDSVQGRWTLSVADLAGRDVGKLNRWGLEIAV